MDASSCLMPHRPSTVWNERTIEQRWKMFFGLRLIGATAPALNAVPAGKLDCQGFNHLIGGLIGGDQRNDDGDIVDLMQM